MKANEAPKKIYMQPSAIEQLPHQNIVYTKPLADNSIEYTLTAAFIEKAAEWIKNKAENYIVDTPLCSYFDYKRAVEEFKEAMKV